MTKSQAHSAENSTNPVGSNGHNNVLLPDLNELPSDDMLSTNGGELQTGTHDLIQEGRSAENDTQNLVGNNGGQHNNNSVLCNTIIGGQRNNAPLPVNTNNKEQQNNEQVPSYNDPVPNYMPMPNNTNIGGKRKNAPLLDNNVPVWNYMPVLNKTHKRGRLNNLPMPSCNAPVSNYTLVPSNTNSGGQQNMSVPNNRVPMWNYMAIPNTANTGGQRNNMPTPSSSAPVPSYMPLQNNTNSGGQQKDMSVSNNTMQGRSAENDIQNPVGNDSAQQHNAPVPNMLGSNYNADVLNYNAAVPNYLPNYRPVLNYNTPVLNLDAPGPNYMPNNLPVQNYNMSVPEPSYLHDNMPVPDYNLLVLNSNATVPNYMLNNMPVLNYNAHLPNDHVPRPNYMLNIMPVPNYDTTVSNYSEPLNHNSPVAYTQQDPIEDHMHGHHVTRDEKAEILPGDLSVESEITEWAWSNLEKSNPVFFNEQEQLQVAPAVVSHADESFAHNSPALPRMNGNVPGGPAVVGTNDDKSDELSAAESVGNIATANNNDPLVIPGSGVIQNLQLQAPASPQGDDLDDEIFHGLEEIVRLER